MKKILQSGIIIGLLLFAFTSAKAQVQVPIPAGTVVNQSVSDGTDPFTGGHLGRTNGITFSYTNPNWPKFSDTCLYFGVGTILTQIINGYNTNPPNQTCGNMSNLSIGGISYGANSTVMYYYGTTNYKYVNTSGVPTTFTLQVQLVLSVSRPVYQFGSLFLFPVNRMTDNVNGNFTVNVIINTYFPGGAMDYPNALGYVPAVVLFDMLHTDPATSICTQWNNGNFYTVKIASTANLTQVLCNGLSTGSIDVSPSGGFGALSYSWSNGATTQDISNIPAGPYSQVITDSRGCMLANSYEITELPKMEINLTKTDALCYRDSAGSINTTITGGTAPYSLVWSTGDTTSNLTHLKAADYSLQVTDYNNCTLDTTVTISQPDSISLLSTVQDPSCFGSNNGSIQLTSSGGVTPYTYTWSNDSTSKDLSGITSGNYSVTLKDQNNCQVVDTFIVNQPDSIGVLALVQGPSCNGLEDGSIQLTTSGGVSPYTYLWSNDETTKDITGLTPGNYSVSITDQHNCQKLHIYAVTEPAVLEHSFDVKNVSCFDGSDGTITLTVTGGTAPYSYLWSNDSTTKDLSSLQANDFSVVVNDFNGCNFTDNTTVEQPDKLSIFLDKSDVLCYGGSSGSIITSVFGGTEPYSFSWNNGDITKDLTGIKAADYSLAVTDYNNCSLNSSVSVYQPDSINILSEVQDASCFGFSDGSIHLTPWGGVPPYSYAWSNNATTKDIDGVPAGNYSLNFTDNNNCLVADNYSVTQPDALGNNFVVNNVSCLNGNNGDINLTVSGGTVPYSYLWSNSSITEDISQLSAGTYSVAITDAHNCSLTDSAKVTQPGPVTAGFTSSASEAVATFTNTSAAGTYSWAFGDGTSGNEVNPVHTFDKTGVYNVCLTVYTNCDTVAICDSVSITKSTRISNSVEKNRISVYPNPNSGSISIERTSANISSSWKIIDQTGRSVLAGVMVSGESQIHVDLSSLAKGVYYLRMEQLSDTPILQKIVKL